jgi:hypothetical protein
MGNGFGGGRGAGRGFGGGMGFGFRGSSPPWPYVGIGRGGLPRHAYFFAGATAAQAPWTYQQALYPFNLGVGGGRSPYTPYPVAPSAFGSAPFGPQVAPEQELDFLRNQAEAIGEQLEQIEKRMHDLESEK